MTYSKLATKGVRVFDVPGSVVVEYYRPNPNAPWGRNSHRTAYGVEGKALARAEQLVKAGYPPFDAETAARLDSYRATL